MRSKQLTPLVVVTLLICSFNFCLELKNLYVSFWFMNWYIYAIKCTSI